MKEFLVIYYSPASTKEVSKEDQAKGMEAWMAWGKKHGANLVNFGAPVAGGQILGQDGKWTGSDKEVSGFSIVKGEDRAAVNAMFEGHPHLAWAPEHYIEVSEFIKM